MALLCYHILRRRVTSKTINVSKFSHFQLKNIAKVFLNVNQVKTDNIRI
jgi:hypothetical protein